MIHQRGWKTKLYANVSPLLTGIPNFMNHIFEIYYAEIVYKKKKITFLQT